MQKMTTLQAEKRIKLIIKQMNKLKDERKKLRHYDGKSWCSECRKYYVDDDIDSELVWDPDGMPGWLDCIRYKCPKGHEWEEG